MRTSRFPRVVFEYGQIRWATSASRSSTAPSRARSWIDAYAALVALASLDRTAKAHVVGLSLDFGERAAERGLELSPIEQPSHNSVACAPRQVDLSTLSSEGVCAGVTDIRPGVAFHYFVTPGDLDRTFEGDRPGSIETKTVATTRADARILHLAFSSLTGPFEAHSREPDDVRPIDVACEPPLAASRANGRGHFLEDRVRVASDHSRR